MRRIPFLRQHIILNHIPGKRYTNTTMHMILTESFDTQKQRIFQLQLFLAQMVNCEKNLNNLTILLILPCWI